MNSGIYKITNIKNNKFYIGSAIKFNVRFSRHKRDLKKQLHANSYLQNAVNKYGINNFKFEILAKCPKKYLIKLEQWFIDNLNPQYNLSPTAGSNLGCRFERRSDLSKNVSINILKDYKQLSCSDISKKYNIPESQVKSLIYKNEIAQDIKKEINFSVSKERKKIKGKNNKQQVFSKEIIEQIAILYNKGVCPIDIARKLFDNENKRYAITKLAKGISYKEYSYLFENKQYHGSKLNLK